MSHFTVLVIGDNIEEQLQPYHEYECTGIEDQYVVEVNEDERVKQYLERELFVGPKKDNGEEDYHYYLESAEKNLTEWAKMTELEYLQRKGLSPEEIEEEIKDYHGFEKKEDGSWYNKTNPNSKWDWWVIGGRWSGFLKLKEGADGDLGSPGFFGSPAEDGYVDSAMKKDIDFEGMFNEAAEKAAKKYDKVYNVIEKLPIAESWKSVKEKFSDIDEARKFYHDQERAKALREVDMWAELDDYQVDRDVYIQRARNKAITTYAIVKDGKWYAKGEMGWWAVSINEIDENDWNQKVVELIESVDDETIFTLVDCHI